MTDNIEKSLRLPPQSSDAEEAVLGCMLIEKQAVPKAIQVLKADSFYNSAHVKIYKSINIIS